MKACDIRNYFVQHADWVDWPNSVDTFKIGDPNVEVRRAAVTWMLTIEAIEAARKLGANLVITHEPTFFTHVDDVSQVANHAVYARKRALIEQAGLTVLRIHDTWDSWPVIGIGDSVATLLGLGEAVANSGRYLKIYQPARTTLGELAARTANRLGMDPVLVAGDANRTVSRVGLSYGALGGLEADRWMAENNADVVIAGELCHWQDIRYLLDCGVAIVLTDHAASENPGLRNLTEFVHTQFKIPADFIEVGSPFRAVRISRQ